MMTKAPKTSRFSALSAIHSVAEAGLRAAGYRWELRREGEAKVGLWRKRISRRGQSVTGGALPKRLVIVPGFGDTPISWLITLMFLHPTIQAEFDELILFDFPGYGGFLNHEVPFVRMDEMMSFFEDVCDDLQPHTMLGHSLGGWLVAHYAGVCGSGERPKRLSRSGGGPGYRGPAHIIPVNPAGVARSLETRKEFEKKVHALMEGGLDAWLPHLFRRPPLWFRLVKTEVSGYLTREEMKQFIASVREDHSVESLLEAIDSDVSLIWGEHDTLIPAACADVWLGKLALKRRRREAIVLRGVGHSPQVEKPFALARAIARSFTAACDPAISSGPGPRP